MAVVVAADGDVVDLSATLQLLDDRGRDEIICHASPDADASWPRLGGVGPGSV